MPRRSSRLLPVEMSGFLLHLIECDGWLAEDGVAFSPALIAAAERASWVRVWRKPDGEPEGAVVTALGRAAFRWGCACKRVREAS